MVSRVRYQTLSGLICLDWYDWNICSYWAVFSPCPVVGIDLFGLIRLKRCTEEQSGASVPMSGLICLDWYDWNSVKDGTSTRISSLVGIELFGLIRLKLPIPWHIFHIEIVGIDLFGLIRLKLRLERNLVNEFHPKSGLICLDWYDWNLMRTIMYNHNFWIVGIDLFGLIRLKRLKEISLISFLPRSGLICLDWYDWNMHQPLCSSRQSHQSGLICLDWYDWNMVSAVGVYFNWPVGIDLFGLIRLKPFRQIDSCPHDTVSWLICLDWYDWNSPQFRIFQNLISEVGIDLFGLIRLKRLYYLVSSCWYSIVGIDLSWLIRLKQCILLRSKSYDLWVGIDLSWLIRLKHDARDECERRHRCTVGIDLFGLIRLKLYFSIPNGEARPSSELICLDWYDWNVTAYRSAMCSYWGRDWSVLIDTIETLLYIGCTYSPWSVGIALLGYIQWSHFILSHFLLVAKSLNSYDFHSKCSANLPTKFATLGVKLPWFTR